MSITNYKRIVDARFMGVGSDPMLDRIFCQELKKVDCNLISLSLHPLLLYAVGHLIRVLKSVLNNTNVLVEPPPFLVQAHYQRITTIPRRTTSQILKNEFVELVHCAHYYYSWQRPR